MAHLANAGFDVFSMDTTGYGRLTRPAADERSVQPLGGAAETVRAAIIPRRVSRRVSHAMTTIGSDWNDIGGVVDYIRSCAT